MKEIRRKRDDQTGIVCYLTNRTNKTTEKEGIIIKQQQKQRYLFIFAIWFFVLCTSCLATDCKETVMRNQLVLKVAYLGPAGSYSHQAALQEVAKWKSDGNQKKDNGHGECNQVGGEQVEYSLIPHATIKCMSQLYIIDRIATIKKFLNRLVFLLFY